MNSTTSTASKRDLSEIVSENNAQNFIAQNKVLVYALITILLSGIVGFGLYKTFAEKSQTAYNSKIYNFESSALKDFLANPTDAAKVLALETGIMKLHEEMGNYLGLLPLVIKSSDALISNSRYVEAKNILSIGEKISKDDFSDYFIMSRQAVVFEDMGEDKLAIDMLEKMTSQSVKVFEGKTYLDLGRLYLKTGNKDKAKTNFLYVVEKAKDEAEFVKIAQLYLARL
jgi:tetratricopeptide (TPR) repeat protein